MVIWVLRKLRHEVNEFKAFLGNLVRESADGDLGSSVMKDREGRKMEARRRGRKEKGGKERRKEERRRERRGGRGGKVAVRAVGTLRPEAPLGWVGSIDCYQGN